MKLPFILFACVVNLTYGVETTQITLDGTTRLSCLIHVAKKAGKEKPPLLIFMPPGSGGQGEANMAYGSCEKFAEAAGIFAVVPVSADGAGFVGAKNDMIVKLVSAITKGYEVNESRIFLGGISRGGVAALEIAGGGNIKIKGAVIVPGVFYQPPAKVAGFKGLDVYLRIGQNDELKWATVFDSTKKVLSDAGAKLDAKLVAGGAHVFTVDWKEIEKWMKSIK
jgi:poly(3-hydroxybutyrate) depolymerase